MWTVSLTQQELGKEPKSVEATISNGMVPIIMHWMLKVSLNGTYKFSNVTFKRKTK